MTICEKTLTYRTPYTIFVKYFLLQNNKMEQNVSNFKFSSTVYVFKPDTCNKIILFEGDRFLDFTYFLLTMDTT